MGVRFDGAAVVVCWAHAVQTATSAAALTARDFLYMCISREVGLFDWHCAIYIKSTSWETACKIANVSDV